MSVTSYGPGFRPLSVHRPMVLACAVCSVTSIQPGFGLSVQRAVNRNRRAESDDLERPA